jgi:transcriptional regulator with XRE-family HTH domain
MEVNYFIYKDLVASNIISLMRSKGYSRLSLSKLTGVSRLDIDQILKSESSTAEAVYNSNISKINDSLGLPSDFLLKSQVATASLDSTVNACSCDGVDSQRSPEVQILMDGLENCLDIFSMYMK